MIIFDILTVSRIPLNNKAQAVDLLHRVADCGREFKELMSGEIGLNSICDFYISYFESEYDEKQIEFNESLQNSILSFFITLCRGNPR